MRKEIERVYVHQGDATYGGGILLMVVPSENGGTGRRDGGRGYVRREIDRLYVHQGMLRTAAGFLLW